MQNQPNTKKQPAHVKSNKEELLNAQHVTKTKKRHQVTIFYRKYSKLRMVIKNKKEPSPQDTILIKKDASN